MASHCRGPGRCTCGAVGLDLQCGSFFWTVAGKVLDSARMSTLTWDVSVLVNFRLRGGMMRVPRDAPGQWTCEYCGMNRCWPTRSTCYRCGEARGHTEERRQHFRNLARAARNGGASNGASAADAACNPAPTETDPHYSEQTALLRAALALFENYDLPEGLLDLIRRNSQEFRLSK